jgi:putative hydrolase of the HAD superfamily
MVVDLIKALFLDVGGVLLTNGWDRQSRKKAAEIFQLDYEEMEKRHALMFDGYETGRIRLKDYLEYAIFYEPRSFSMDDFKQFIFSQSEPYPEMIELIKQFKDQFRVKIVLVSNEGHELTHYRIQKFKLKEFVDIFVFSCFLHLRKPDLGMYQIALDVTQVEPHEVIYIDDRPLLVEIANRLGMKGIHHVNIELTRQALADITRALAF